MNKIKDVINTLAVLTFVGLVFYGYVMNLIYLFNLQSFNGELVLRAIGAIVPPLGAILGFL